MATPLEQLQEFLVQHGVNIDELVLNPDDDIGEFVADNFDHFTQDILHKLVAAALKVRDQNTNSDGTLKVDEKDVMELVRQITSHPHRRQSARSSLQDVVSKVQLELSMNPVHEQN